MTPKMSPIRHPTLCKSMKFDVKNCTRNCFCDGCNLLKNCKLCHCMLLRVKKCSARFFPFAMRRPGVRIPAAPPIKSMTYGEALLAVFIPGAKPLPKTSEPLATREFSTALSFRFVGWLSPVSGVSFTNLSTARRFASSVACV